MTISGVTVPSASSGSTTDGSRLTTNYNTFLTLLTTQLRNQSPLEPTDANQFTQQLVQFSSIEQQIKMNTNLEDMKSSLAIANATSLLNYVGATVTADGAQTTLQNGAAKWSFTLPKAASGKITVKDAAGEVVYEQTRDLTAGSNTFDWNGRMANGYPVPEGTYTISFDLQDSDGSAVKATTDVSGVVDGLDFSSGQPYLNIGGLSVSVWSVKSINRPT